jgi:signal transduction histidine kinase
LVVVLAGDLISMRHLDLAGRWWVIAGVILMGGVALVAPLWPVRAGLGAAAVLLCWSAVLRLVGADFLPVLGPLLGTEVAALMAVIVVVVRRVTRRMATGIVGLLLASSVAVQFVRPPYLAEPGQLVWNVVLPAVVLSGLCIAAGLYLRARDNEQTRATEAAVAAAQQRERVSLARELHDVVAHHIGGVVVQAQAAQAVASTDPGAAARVLPVIEGAGTDALSAMRRMVGALRDSASDPENTAPLTLTTDLTADLHAVTATPTGGTPVRLAVELAEPVPAEVSTSVLRLVQESVTNARRHAAGASEIAVTVQTDGGFVRLQVRDDGRGDGRTAGEPKKYGGGYGLVGMRERVQLLGGVFSAGRGRSGGWQVAAEVPLRDSGR